MTKAVELLSARVQQRFGDNISVHVAFAEVTVEVLATDLLTVCLALRDEEGFRFEELIDLAGVDLLTYGQSEWDTSNASGTGFSRGVKRADKIEAGSESELRFAVVYHLLSVSNNQRIRIKALLPADVPVIDSVIGIWSSADWFEREAFDLFGVMFKGHPDLRRLLTDYGFIGHPFRKDFPVQGNVEMRYDAEKRRVVYEPVSIEPRTLVPRVIRGGRNASASAEGEA